MFSTGDREFIGSWNVGIQLSIPLSELLWPRSRSHSETAKARIVTSQTELQKEKVSDFIRLEVRQAVLRLAQQYRQISAHKEAIELSSRGVSIANQRFNAGQMSNVELMDAELDYQQAQLSYFQAWFEYISAKIDIERATGLY
jgi:outer membrane protein